MNGILGKALNEAKIMGDLEERILLKHVLKELPTGSFFYKVKDKLGFRVYIAQGN